MSIFYAGSFLGSARVEAGSQPPRSCQMIRLPARLSGLELAHHAKSFLADVARREMVLDAAVDIEGAAKLLWWDHRFKVHVDSHVTVDPIFLDGFPLLPILEMGGGNGPLPSLDLFSSCLEKLGLSLLTSQSWSTSFESSISSELSNPSPSVHNDKLSEFLEEKS
nr:uncharacterized protein LOC109192908 [Ipomoea batatas]